MHLHFACCINAFTINFNENKLTQPKICILLAKVLNETTIAIKTKESNLIRNILKLVTATTTAKKNRFKNYGLHFHSLMLL